MQVGDGLPGVIAIVHHDAVAAGVEPELGGHDVRDEHAVSKQRGVLGGGVCQTGQGEPRNDQHMHRRCGVYIAKGEDLVVFVHDVCGDGAGGDLLEQGQGNSSL